MDNFQLTTPFGRRGVTIAHFAKQMAARDIKPNASHDKWKLFRILCEAKSRIGISDRSLAVLNALLSFYPKTELSEKENLIVFPSNEQIALRAHGMPEQTLRRHLAALVEAGLILRKDSPNGKRYARKDKSGVIRDAFGFSLAPLLARLPEFTQMADELETERQEMQSLKEKLSLHKRNIITFLQMAESESLTGDWKLIETRFAEAISKLPRSPKKPELAICVDTLVAITTDLSKYLENNNKTENLSGNDCQNERHLKSSESESQSKSDFKKSDLIFDPVPQATLTAQKPIEQQISLPTVLKACPDIIHYGPSGTIRGWNDLKYASSVVMKMFSIPHTLYAKAVKVMGEGAVLSVIACILQKGSEIASAGGYLTSLIRQAEQGKFSLEGILMPLMRRTMLN